MAQQKDGAVVNLMAPLILASQSAGRAALLRAAGLAFTAMPAHIDEAAIKEAGQADAAAPGDVAVHLAALKAERVARRAGDGVVIAADQLLVCDGVWYDKPADLAAAADQLRALRGRTHVLETAVVCWRDGRRVWQHLARPRLTMRRFSDAFLAAYLTREGDTICGSVGAYRLEGLGIHLFERIEGEQSAIIGLPMLPLLGFLRQSGVMPDGD